MTTSTGFVVVDERLEQLHGVGLDANRAGPSVGLGRPGQADGLVDVRSDDIEVPGLQPSVEAGGVDVRADDDAAVHGDRERLGAPHAPDAGGQGERAGQGAAEAFGGNRGERLVSALQDALGADVDPRAGGHLPVHGQAQLLQAPELVPVVPLADQVAVGDKHPGRPLVGPQHADRPAGLDQEGLVVPEVLQGAEMASKLGQSRAALPEPP